MWIEVDLYVTDPECSENATEWKTLFNSNLVVSISPVYFHEILESPFIEFHIGSIVVRFCPFTTELTKAIYQGFILSLQGQETKFEGIGHIKPLLSEQREQLHKYMLYKETINHLTHGVGL